MPASRPAQPTSGRVQGCRPESHVCLQVNPGRVSRESLHEKVASRPARGLVTWLAKSGPRTFYKTAVPSKMTLQSAAGPMEGLNERFTGRSFFGYGAYLAEDAGKTDQYVAATTQSEAPMGLWQLLYGGVEKSV